MRSTCLTVSVLSVASIRSTTSILAFKAATSALNSAISAFSSLMSLVVNGGDHRFRQLLSGGTSYRAKGGGAGEIKASEALNRANSRFHRRVAGGC